jgi:hypothetical protein
MSVCSCFFSLHLALFLASSFCILLCFLLLLSRSCFLPDFFAPHLRFVSYFFALYSLCFLLLSSYPALYLASHSISCSFSCFSTCFLPHLYVSQYVACILSQYLPLFFAFLSIFYTFLFSLSLPVTWFCLLYTTLFCFSFCILFCFFLLSNHLTVLAYLCTCTIYHYASCFSIGISFSFCPPSLNHFYFSASLFLSTRSSNYSPLPPPPPPPYHIKQSLEP